jgi:site-specific DNA-cytosine methylase
MGRKGDDIREKLEDIALKANYSVLYFKTDTKLHENCQRRPRTFVIFTKHRSDSNLEAPALFNFEDKHINVKDFFRNIPDNLTQNEPVKTSFHNFILIDYIKHKVGDNYKDLIHNSLMRYVEDNGLFDDFMDFCNSSDKYSVADKVGTKKIIDHIKYKRSLGMNYYANDACSFVDEEFPAVIFKSMSNTLHPFKDEMCSIRDYLTLMGHPFDFELYGNEGNIPRIGQNVPVKTAKYIVSEAVRCLNEKKLFNDNTNVIFQDNISKRTIIDYNCTNKSKALF